MIEQKCVIRHHVVSERTILLLILSLSLAWETSQVVSRSLAVVIWSFSYFTFDSVGFWNSVLVQALRHLYISPSWYSVYNYLVLAFVFIWFCSISSESNLSRAAYFVFHKFCKLLWNKFHIFSLPVSFCLSVSNLLYLSSSISVSLLLFPLHHFRTLHHETFTITWWGLWPGNTVFHTCQHTRRVHYSDKRKTTKFVAKLIWRCWLSLEWIPTDPRIRVCVREK